MSRHGVFKGPLTDAVRVLLGRFEVQVNGDILATSWQFDEAPRGEAIPRYVWHIEDDGTLVAVRVQAIQTAPEILQAAATVLAARGALRDSEAGERSMARCVAAFNAMTGLGLTERDGWYFMCCLKEARSRAGAYHADDLVDLVGYAALEAECHAATG